MTISCAHCQAEFACTEHDRALLDKLKPIVNGEKVDLRPPTLCPSCRMQRRFAIRNEEKLYERSCDLSGESFISLYSPSSVQTVYKEDVWHSDAWDPFDYGIDYDFSKPFFDQFADLRLRVPRRGMQQDGTVENSEYCSYSKECKDCYLSFSCGFSEDIYHSGWLIMCRSCMDCFACLSCELLYECIDCVNCYNCMYCEQSDDCQDSFFLDHCRNCHHCIGCKNLRNKGYHIFNEPVSKEEFTRVQQGLLEGDMDAIKEQFEAWRTEQPSLYIDMKKSENCSGNGLAHAHNCHNCFDILMGGEDLRHCQLAGWKGKDMMDCSISGKESELMYECTGVLRCHRIYFCNSIQQSNDCYYCECIKNCSHCFGCIGMNYKKYCILNKQYTKEEYEELVPKILRHMQETKEWGEFPPMHISPFCYNETIAQDYFPLTKEQILAEGLLYREENIQMPELKKIIPAEKLPKSTAAIPDDILNWVLICEKSKKPYHLSEQEWQLCKQMNIPVPRMHPEERSALRRARRRPFRLWNRTCSDCGIELRTAYDPEQPHRVVCDNCYLNTVYGDANHNLNKNALNKLDVTRKDLMTKTRVAQKVLSNAVSFSEKK